MRLFMLGVVCPLILCQTCGDAKSAYKSTCCNQPKETPTNLKTIPKCNSTCFDESNDPNHVFDQLSIEEHMSLIDWMYEQNMITCKSPAFTFYTGSVVDCVSHYNFNSTGWTEISWIDRVSLYSAPKVDMLSALNGGIDPPRYAHMWLYNGRERTAKRIKVGPLGAHGTSVSELEQTTWLERPMSQAENFILTIPFASFKSKIANLTRSHFLETLEEVVSSDSLVFINWPDLDRSKVQSKRIDSFQTHIETLPDGGGQAPYLQGASVKAYPLSGSIVLDWDTDILDWSIENIMFCNQGPFSSPEHLMRAFEQNELQFCELSSFLLSDENTMKPIDASRSLKNAPNIVAPQCNIKRNGKTIHWQDWSFHVDIDPVNGIKLSNVLIRGERIIYEMGPTDFSATYSSSKGAVNMFFMDTSYLMGAQSSPLTRGIDCPQHSIMMDAPIDLFGAGGFSFLGASPISNAVCVFEHYEGKPLFRHDYQPDGYQSYKGLPSYALVVRAIGRPGNYDYITDTIFFMDGRIKVEVTFGGYTFATYGYETELGTFGSLIAPHIMGSLHMHHTSYRIDIDVGEYTENEFHSISFQEGTYADAGITKPSNVQADRIVYAKDTMVDNEIAFMVNGDHSTYKIVSKHEKNSYGSQRGFSLHLPSGRMLLGEESPYSHVLNSSKSNMVVVKQSDTEPSNTVGHTHLYRNTPSILDTHTLLNNESIDGQDLVAYISLNKNHFPIAEDLPTVSGFGVSFTLQPSNYFDRAAYSNLHNDLVESVNCEI